MIRLLLICVVLAVLVVLAVWANQIPWGVVIEGPDGGGFELTLTGAALIILVLGALAALAWSLVTSILLMPNRFRASRRKRRAKKGNEAMAAGLLAIEGGDLKTARKQSRKALADGEDDRLSLLLEARTAEQEADWAHAERAYSELARKPGAQLAALKGLTGTALKRGDLAIASQHARAAINLKGERNSWAFTSLFEIAVMQGDWAAARAALPAGEEASLVTADQARRRKAVLLTAQASNLTSTAPDEADLLLQDAVKIAPGFAPAVFLLARQHIKADRMKQAVSVLETGWKSRPHPALAMLAREIDAHPSAPSKKAMIALVNANPAHRETRLLQVDAAIEKGNWTEAEALLRPFTAERATSRLCRLMEIVARGDGELADAREWGRRAGSAPREPEWSDIEPGGSAFLYTREDWARLVYAFGDAAQLIHPRHEGYGADLDVTEHLALPAPREETPEPLIKPKLTAPKPAESE